MCAASLLARRQSARTTTAERVKIKLLEHNKTRRRLIAPEQQLLIGPNERLRVGGRCGSCLITPELRTQSTDDEKERKKTNVPDVKNIRRRRPLFARLSFRRGCVSMASYKSPDIRRAFFFLLLSSFYCPNNRTNV